MRLLSLGTAAARATLAAGARARLGGRDLRHDLLEGMDTQVQRLRPLLDSLTNLHGQVLGTLELNLKPIALSDWLVPTITPWRQAAHDKGLHWQMEIPDSLPVVEISGVPAPPLRPIQHFALVDPLAPGLSGSATLPLQR